MNNNNRLKRDVVIEITNEFVENIKKYKPFNIPSSLYLEFFNKLDNLFNQFDFDDDDRFVTYGRLNFLREEFSERLNDDNLRKNNLNWKNKWDNRLGAFWDLYDYINGDRFISINNISDKENFDDIVNANEQYYKEGYICKQERDILQEMINEISIFINNCSKKNSF